MTLIAGFKKFVVVALLAAGVLVVQPSVASAVGGSNPPAPTGLTAITAGGDSVRLNWTAPASTGGTPITDYAVRFSDDSGITWTLFVHPPAAALSAVVTGLSQGTTYLFEVAGVNSSGIDTGNGAGVGTWSAPASAIPATVPEAPTGVAAVLVHATSADLQWDEPISNGGHPITSYTMEARSHQIVAIDAGANHNCVVVDDGSVKCWGANAQQQLGLGDTANRGDGPDQMGANLPSVDLGVGHTALQAATGADHSCALLDDSSVRCWGDNTGGRLGVGDTTSTVGPVDLGTNRTAKSIAAGNGFTCAVLDNASVKCWGVNNVGQLGQGDTTLRGGSPATMGDFLLPVDLGTVGGLGFTPYKAVAVSAGDNHVCVLLDGSDPSYHPVKCWGLNASGQLGQGDTANHGDVAGTMGDGLDVVDLGTDALAAPLLASQVSAGGNSSCAVLNNSTTKCWGDNSSAQLGLGDTNNRGDNLNEMGADLPAVDLGVDATLTAHVALTVTNAADHTCALLEDWSVRCWGNNVSGQLGLGTSGTIIGDSLAEMGNNLQPIDLGTGRTATDVETGATHTCALLDDASVKCWGGNAYGQLGLGNTAPRGNAAGQMGNSLLRAFTPTVVSASAGLPLTNPLTATLGGLEPGVQQTIHVAAVNDIGQSNWSPDLIVVPSGPPTAPTGLMSTGVTGTSVSLSWTAPPFAGTPVTDYVVQFSTTGGEPWTTFLDGVSPATTATVTGLTKGTLTSFRVAAINGDPVTGDFSATAADTPATAPSDPLNPVTVPGHTSMVVAWDLPLDGGGVPITDYVVQYRVLGTIPWFTYLDGVSTANVAEINTLNPDGHYEARVAAVNGIGQGPFSVIATADLVPGPPRAPTNLRVTAKSGTSITVAWDAPLDTGGSPITDYQLQYQLAAGGGGDVIDLHSANTSATITLLDIGTAYVINVAASNDGGPGVGFAGFGPMSLDLAASTATYPDAPSGVHATGHTGKTITVAWTAPASDGGAALTKYHVRWKLHSDLTDNNWMSTDTVPANTSLPISNLTEGVTYDFQVLAHNSVGDSAYSSVLTASTLDFPGAPTALDVTGRTATSVALSWGAPVSDGGTAITDYIVEYWSPGGDPLPFPDGVSTTPAATVTGLTQGVTYTFQVTAVNAVGSANPSTVTGVPYTTPGQPGTPVGVPGNRTATLTWTAPADDGGSAITAYRVERSTNGTSWTPLTSTVSAVAPLKYTATLLTNGTAYRFRLTAQNAAGWGAASVMSTAVVPRTLATAPGKPVVAAWNTQLSVSWGAPASNGGAAITAYRVERSTNGRTWTLVTATAPLTRTIVVGHLTNGVTYRFRVAARNAAGQGPWSLVAAGAAKPVPGAPGTPRAVAGAGKVTLTWSAPITRGSSAITAYRVQRSVDGIAWVTVTSAAPLTRTYTVTGLARGKAYRFRVAAINTLGAGAWSAVAAATPR